MYWQTAEFNEDITKYNYIQLADWIERCRLVVNWNEYIRLEKTREEYLADLDGFCKEWEAHYQWHEETYKRNSVYKSNKFRKALVYLQFRKRVSFIVDYGKTKETQSISAYEKQTNRLYMKKQVEESFQKIWHTHYELVEDIFVPDEEKPVELLEVDAETGKPIIRTYKEKIDRIFSEQLFCEWEVNIKALKNRKKLYTESFDDFVKTCNDDNEYEIKVEVRKRKRSYKNAIEDMGITHTTYCQWQNANECEKDIDKKIFVNMCFCLCLSLPLSEQLLGYNGFSIKNSKRQFDKICEMALRIGFDRQMAIDLIDKWNFEKSDDYMSKNKKYLPVPNLTKNG